MIIFVEDRELVSDAFQAMFEREGFASAGLNPVDFATWLSQAPDEELRAIDAVIMGECVNRLQYAARLKSRTRAAVIAMNDSSNLDQTLQLFASGFDDVVRKPVHVKELLARIDVARKRIDPPDTMVGTICVFPDGRPPLVGGSPLELPRRQKRILEYLVKQKGKRISKTQLFSTIYGIFDAEVDENSLESHISKLRKKLRHRLGYDPIDSKRFLGYCLNAD
jgi:two-component system, OmpR family, flagellar system response regulator FtcR